MLTEADYSLLETMRLNGYGMVLIARALSEERGAFEAVGKKSRDRYVGKDLVAGLLKTLASENTYEPPKTSTIRKTMNELEVGSTKHQTLPKEEQNGY